MDTGRVLLRLAQRLCTKDTRQQILEALIADLQHELAGARTPAQRRSIRLKGTWAFWTTLTHCVARSLVQLPARITFMGGLIAFYWAAILLVIVYGVTWVRTGALTAADGLLTLVYVSVFAPGVLWATMSGRWREHAARRRGLYLALFLVLIAEVIIVPGHRPQRVFALACACIGVVRRERSALRETAA